MLVFVFWRSTEVYDFFEVRKRAKGEVMMKDSKILILHYFGRDYRYHK